MFIQVFHNIKLQNEYEIEYCNNLSLYYAKIVSEVQLILNISFVFVICNFRNYWLL